MGLLDQINPIKSLVSGIVDSASSLIKDFVTDPAQKLALTAQLAKQSSDLDMAILDASKSTVVAEEQGELWIQKAWRPLVSMGLFLCIMYAGPIVSIFHFPQMNMSGVPQELWSTFRLCVGGYMGLRTVDKGISAFTKGGTNGS